MSPAKSKDPTPAKKNTKAKARAAESKPAAASTRRKSLKTGDLVEKKVVAEKGVNADADAARKKPAAQRAPKAATRSATPTAADGASEGDASKVKPVTQVKAVPAGDMPAKVAPPNDKGTRSLASGAAGTALSAATKAGKTEPVSASKGADARSGTAVAGGPTATGATEVADTADSSQLTAGRPISKAVAASLETEKPAKPAGQPPAAPPSVPTPPAPPDDKPMDFPKGALIAFRKSGGLKFSSREIVVYPDGRVTYDGGDTAKSSLTRAARRLSDAQVVRLRRTLDQINFFGMKPPLSKADPDGFVVEIAARLGGKNNHVEVNAAEMPGALTALVDQLATLLPSEE